MKLTTDKPASPLGILVAGANGALATVPIHKDASGGFVAKLGDVTFYVSATVTGRTSDA
ncbi:hypothetical protein [Mycolicibacterium conceptionense]|uniref:hypothetical protein n=1 Tax=Mycolicibacterium conceptionense TaxID=451644 RepID=UPI003204F048